MLIACIILYGHIHYFIYNVGNNFHDYLGQTRPKGPTFNPIALRKVYNCIPYNFGFLGVIGLNEILFKKKTNCLL